MKIRKCCPIEKQVNVWEKLTRGKFGKCYGKLKLEMEKHLVGIKCFIIGECGGLPFLILGLNERTNTLIDIASSVAWT